MFDKKSHLTKLQDDWIGGPDHENDGSDGDTTDMGCGKRKKSSTFHKDSDQRKGTGMKPRSRHKESKSRTDHLTFSILEFFFMVL